MNDYRDITAPRLGTESMRGIFLAGGITDCPDWQSEAVQALCCHAITVFNPRQANFDITNPNAAREQITWEHNHLRHAMAILFWFPCETLCPITLYELGAWSMTEKPIFVGMHPDYKRADDVFTQTRLARPEVQVYTKLYQVTNAVVEFYHTRKRGA